MKHIKNPKLWFLNVVLVLIWVAILSVCVVPFITIDGELKIVLYGHVAAIPCFFIAESVAIWRSKGVDIELKSDKE